MPSEELPVPVMVTGRGVVSPIGLSIPEFEASLAASRGGIRRYDDIFPGRSVHVGLVAPFESEPGIEHASEGGCDRAAQMSAAAVSQALREAGLWDGVRLSCPAERTALLLGTSHGGRSQLDAFVEADMDADSPELARDVLERGAHHHQAAVTATCFGIHGPVVTFSTACSSSGSAISAGIDLLRSGRVDVVVVGGADAYSKLTHSGFAALGATADSPCAPFSDNIGMTLGEAAAFIVLEREDSVRSRNARALGEIYACGSSWDAHHLTAPEPSGDGMRRAIRAALKLGGIDPADIQYINAHATGTRANDISETLAIKRVFADLETPPVSATKSFTGHTLGASSVIGVLAGMTATSSGRIPPTLNFNAPRPGCDLDYVPSTSRETDTERFLAQSAAFGGANCVIAAGRPRARQVPEAVPTSTAGIAITGMGFVSPLGCSKAEFLDGVMAGQDARPRIEGFDARKHLPAGKARRMGLITQHAIAATEQALADAGLPPGKRDGSRVGLMVGLCRGSTVNFETYLDSVRGGSWETASPTAFPNLVMSSVGGQISIATGLKDVASTVVGGAEVGFALLSTAAESLLHRSDVDAIVVVAADELAPLFTRLECARRGEEPSLPLAEGAMAFTLERADAAAGRGVRVHAELAGWAQGFEGVDRSAREPTGQWLEMAARQALERADCEPEDVAAVVSLACRNPAMDAREAAALGSLFTDDALPITTLSGSTGLAESTAAFHATASAVLALAEGRLPAPSRNLRDALHGPWLHAPARVDGDVALALGGGEFGGNGAIVVRRPTTDRPS